MDAPPMFTFHHVNAFTTTAPGSSNGNGNGNGSSGNGSRGKQQLVLDTVAWDEVAFENNQVRHNNTLVQRHSSMASPSSPCTTIMYDKHASLVRPAPTDHVDLGVSDAEHSLMAWFVHSWSPFNPVPLLTPPPALLLAVQPHARLLHWRRQEPPAALCV
jgi:hypothetical protein